ncbi:MAG TPA: biotin--[acetyl-CoA-carboxylase] ligase, partial [Phycisphaerae bacterium]|nr:biotin--[acetyl-CoA-carboxylase] ligase [Phycisphaerae bacterium]
MAEDKRDPSITADELLAGWTPRRVGRRITVVAEAESTNTLAMQAAEPDADGLAILADAQTAGRGRLGAIWLSPRGASVLCSIVLIEPKRDAVTSGAAGASAPGSLGEGGPHPLLEERTSAWLTHVAAVAACDAIRQATDVTPAIKWPNDLRIAERKVGGILIETRAFDNRTRAWVVGIGINCLQHAGHFPPEIRESATSLELATHHPVDRTAVARELLRSLDRRLPPEAWGRTEQVHHDWLAYA